MYVFLLLIKIFTIFDKKFIIGFFFVNDGNYEYVETKLLRK